MKVLFVCLGNICRSPAAEGIFINMVQSEGLQDSFQIDSAGTGAWHEGEPADGRMREHAKQRGYELPSIARQFKTSDFKEFDYILTMDNMNFEDVIALADNQQEKDKVRKMVSFCKVHDVPGVPDPYHGGDDGFRLVMDILEDGCSELLKKLKEEMSES
ncbi:MAG: low molecular weight phosphotyrosine protein phosphatase [Bdellovibrionales bacterium]|nr:low molecular weight phosphotyrosine protein phosphatase [Bdellovibrionales bacterium]